MSEIKIDINRIVDDVLPKLANVMKNLMDANSACESAEKNLPSNFSDRGSVSDAISKMCDARDTINDISSRMHKKIEMVANIESSAYKKEQELMNKIRKASKLTGNEEKYGSIAKSLGLDANDIKDVKANVNHMTVVCKDGTTYSYSYTQGGAQITNETHKDSSGNISSSITYSNGNKVKETTYICGKIDTIKRYSESGSIIAKDKYGYSESDGSLLYVKQEIYKSREIITKCDVYLDGKKVGSLDKMALEGNMTIEELESSGFFDFSDCTRMGETGGRTTLTEEEVAVLNRMVEAAVEVNGKGTGKAVAAAATTLISGLKELGVYIPYYLGGGHMGGDEGTGLYTGVNPNLGAKVSPSGISTLRDVNGYDCSGFIMWAMRTAGIDISHYGSGNAMISGANQSKISETSAGDVLARTDGGHVIMVLNTYEKDGVTYVACAESTTSKYGGTDDGGAIFTEYTVEQLANMGYYGISMEGAYKERIDDGPPPTVNM